MDEIPFMGAKLRRKRKKLMKCLSKNKVQENRKKYIQKINDTNTWAPYNLI